MVTEQAHKLFDVDERTVQLGVQKAGGHLLGPVLLAQGREKVSWYILNGIASSLVFATKDKDSIDLMEWMDVRWQRPSGGLLKMGQNREAAEKALAKLKLGLRARGENSRLGLGVAAEITPKRTIGYLHDDLGIWEELAPRTSGIEIHRVKRRSPSIQTARVA